MPKRPCVGCHRVIAYGTICESCRRKRDEQRIRFEPWRRLYQTPEWARAQRECLNRDGGQCRARTGSGRCEETQHLQAHHQTPLRVLWRQAEGDWVWFVSAATRLSALAALCPTHHAQAERALRAGR